jgi:hypothetical protein
MDAFSLLWLNKSEKHSWNEKLKYFFTIFPRFQKYWLVKKEIAKGTAELAEGKKKVVWWKEKQTVIKLKSWD